MYKYNQMAKQKAYESSIQSVVSGNIHPILAYMKITRECDMSCAYCVEQHMMVNNDMEFEEWKRAADIIYALGCRTLSLVGGEPLLSPYVPDLVNYISARDTFVGISTNGHCLNEELLHVLDEAGLDSLNFSIDTLGNCGQPQFGKNLTQELENILKYTAKTKFRFRTSVAAVVTKYNIAVLPEMLQYFSNLGMPFRFTLMVRGVINHGYTEKLALGEEDLDEVEKVIEKLSVMKSGGCLLGNENLTRFKVRMGVRTPAAVYQMHMGDATPHRCKGGIYDLPVNNDGLLSACCTGLTSSTHIFDLGSIEDYHAYIKQNRKITDQCKGCPWPHKWVLTHLEETGGFMKQ